LIVTGIANPQPFKEFVQTIANEVVHIEYPDHYQFGEQDIAIIRESFARQVKSPVKYIVTTEKDSIRLKEVANITDLLQNEVYYFPIGINFLHDSKTGFDKLITDYVRRNRVRHS
jgi:tetraacyldisaccharide 4'-kinase